MIPSRIPVNLITIATTCLGDVANWFAFQINHPSRDRTTPLESDSAKLGPLRFGKQNWLEIFAVFAIFAWLTSSITPGVNESHYLTKAKHFWNPDWCANDIFLSSTDAHLFFFFIGGWPTLFLSLDIVAWIGRTICWLGAAAAWVNLNHTIGLKRWFSVVSSTLFVLLIERFDMAGEWVIGGYEAKSVAYVFVLWGLSLFLQERFTWFWPVIGCAIAFHAVVGIWALICFSGVLVFRFIEQSTQTQLKIGNWTRSQTMSVSLFILLVATGIMPPLLANSNVPAQIIRSANEIQVHQRLSHHLFFGSFLVSHVARFGFLIAVLMIVFHLSRKTVQLHWINLFAIFSMAISLAGIFLSGLAEQRGAQFDFANSLLRFYWFRFSDFAVPLALSCCLTYFAGRAIESNSLAKRRAIKFSSFCLFAAAIVVFFESAGDWRSGADRMTLPNYPDSPIRTQQTFENWKKVCYWIRMNTRTDSMFLTPYQFQTFKWHAQRCEVACWKDMPQDAKSIVDWRERIQFQQAIDNSIVGGVLGLEEKYLKEFVDKYGITHILARQANEDQVIGNRQSYDDLVLSRIYPVENDAKSTFVVYSVTNAE